MKFLEQAKKKMTPLMEEPWSNRAKRRERTRVHFSRPKDYNKPEGDRWEWKPTQTHPATRKAKRRHKNKMARASRKANR